MHLPLRLEKSDEDKYSWRIYKRSLSSCSTGQPALNVLICDHINVPTAGYTKLPQYAQDANRSGISAKNIIANVLYAIFACSHKEAANYEASSTPQCLFVTGSVRSDMEEFDSEYDDDAWLRQIDSE